MSEAPQDAHAQNHCPRHRLETSWFFSSLLPLPARTPSPLPHLDYVADELTGQHFNRSHRETHCQNVEPVRPFQRYPHVLGLLDIWTLPGPDQTCSGKSDQCIYVWTTRLPAVLCFCFCPLLNKRSSSNWTSGRTWQFCAYRILVGTSRRCLTLTEKIK